MDSDDSMIDIYPFLCCSLLSFAAVAIVTKRRKRDNKSNNNNNNNNNMPPSSTISSNNSTSTNNKLRMVALCFISFAIGLQFKYAIELMISSESSSLNDEYSWAPDDMEVEWPKKEEDNNDEKNEITAANVRTPPKHRRNNNGYINPEQQQQNAVEETPRQRRRRKRREQQAEEGSSAQPKKKKKYKPPRRYEASNYTNDFKPLPWSLPQPNILRDMSSETFMAGYIKAKRKHNISLPWDSDEKEKKYRNKKVSLPLPIISLNFPKSATLTMKTYFDCGGLTSIHTSTQDGRIGICMMENQMKGLPPMNGCDTHKERHRELEEGEEEEDADEEEEEEEGSKVHKVVPIDFISDIGLQGPPCYYASLHDGGLENIARHYPNGTILLVTRNATSWARSIGKWGSILHRWEKVCGFDGHIHNTTTNMKYWNNMYEQVPWIPNVSHEKKRMLKEEYWVNFYLAHTQKIREFAMKHLSLTYVEVELENENMGKILQEYTKVSPDCVMDCHPGPKWIKQNNATSRCHPVGQNPTLLKEIQQDGENGDINDEDRDNVPDDDNTDDDSTAEDGEEELEEEETEDDEEIKTEQ